MPETKLLQFNNWSKERIEQGRKICTSRRKKYIDPRVYLIIRIPLWIVKIFLWKEEGADNPEEFERIWRAIHRGHFKPDNLVYVHFGNFMHNCSFGFESKTGLYEPKKGERGYSTKKDDWVCRCGKTRREYLKEIADKGKS